MNKEPKETRCLLRIKEGNLNFFTEVLKLMEDYIRDNYKDAIGFIRNGEDGCYELLVEIYEY
jgi:hypothetical protein